MCSLLNEANVMEGLCLYITTIGGAAADCGQ